MQQNTCFFKFFENIKNLYDMGNHFDSFMLHSLSCLKFRLKAYMTAKIE